MPPPEKKGKLASLIFGNEALSDVTVFVENQDFVVHRMTLAGRSDFFQALFYGNFKEAKEDQVEIKEVSPDMFKRVVEIIYNGRMADCTALRFAVGRQTIDNQKSCYHYCPSAYAYDSAKISLHQSLQKFWDFVHELLEVADRFNITDLVLKCLQDEVIKSMRCVSNCAFCTNLYMFALDKKMPIHGKFQIFKNADYTSWTNTVFNKSASMRPPLRQLEPQELNTLVSKFS